MQQGRTPSGSGEVTLGEAVLQVLTLQPVPVNGGKAVAEAVFGVEEGRVEQQATEQQQDSLLRPAHDQLVDDAAGLVITAQGVFEP